MKRDEGTTIMIDGQPVREFLNDKERARLLFIRWRIDQSSDDDAPRDTMRANHREVPRSREEG